jgi:hypothetical protein
MGTAAAIIMRKQRDIVQTFRASGAVSRERARVPGDLGVDENLVFKGLVRRAVLRDAGRGRYYLDEPSWNALHMIRRRMAAVAVLFFLAAVLLLGIVTLQ